MNGKWLPTIIVAVAVGLGWSLAEAQFPNNPTWTTLLKVGDVHDEETVGPMEGLTGDNNGNFYVADRGELDGGADPTNSDTCHVWRINANTGDVDLVGQITADPCQPSGLTFDHHGDLFITTGGGGGIIYRLTPNAADPTGPGATGSVYATGVPGANGVAFLGDALFVTDGTANQGRVWKIGPGGGICELAFDNCVEFLRVPPRRNGEALGGNVLIADQPFGVGSVRFTVPRFEIDVCNNMAMPACPPFLDRQDIVANGIAFTVNGKKAYISDTARGAIWQADLTPFGDLAVNQTGCDPTFHDNALCMHRLYVAHPLLEGVDGIVLLKNGTILASVNERNAIVAVNRGNVVDLFQNAPDPVTLLRNGRFLPSPPEPPNTLDQAAPLEFPTSPFASGKTFCTTGADSPRRDNNPNAPGEGSKVICLDQNLQQDGLPLPVNG